MRCLASLSAWSISPGRIHLATSAASRAPSLFRSLKSTNCFFSVVTHSGSVSPSSSENMSPMYSSRFMSPSPFRSMSSIVSFTTTSFIWSYSSGCRNAVISSLVAMPSAFLSAVLNLLSSLETMDL
uniref:Uncharacterized protein n=1 Tax=Anguilla anguilla TaxID=7936 RepID=A0A0E9XCZ7_ANGAN